MRLFTFQKYMEQVDLLIRQIGNQSSQHSSSLRIRASMYKQFLNKIKQKQRKDRSISQQIGKISEIIQQKILQTNQLIKASSNKRGRPIKNKQVEQKLIQWINLSGRISFTKKQIKAQYSKLLGKKIRTLPSSALFRICSRCEQRNIRITSRQTGKNTSYQQKRQKKAILNDMGQKIMSCQNDSEQKIIKWPQLSEDYDSFFINFMDYQDQASQNKEKNSFSIDSEVQK